MLLTPAAPIPVLSAIIELTSQSSLLYCCSSYLLASLRVWIVGCDPLFLAEPSLLRLLSHFTCNKETHENGRPIFLFVEDLSKRKAGTIVSSATLREAVQLSADEVNAIGSSESVSIKMSRNKPKRRDAHSLKKKSVFVSQ
ncbi:hypothetical protein KP509_13G082400 [Ceratopteris richardii]|uniref:Uncharacterized protein n=1 Tax=Ceratopteris richardii TaxID=49495 RepID=A0A8T2THI7_CERRI|nr:hypothetical protein KP509_13G082400 [Ceratopteris richardii]